MIRVLTPAAHRREGAWVCAVVFGEFLGLPWELAGASDEGFRLELDGRSLELPSPLLGMRSEAWPDPAALPALPLPLMAPSAVGLARCEALRALPVLFGRPALDLGEDRIRCEADLLGGIFFMLSRYEELATPARDRHERFPGEASLAHRARFLERPLVDEYVEWLWALLHLLWPGLPRRRRRGRISVSCDVDIPFDYSVAGPGVFARAIAGDLLKRLDPAGALRRTRNFLGHRRGDFRHDPCYTFGWYMDACERHGHRAAFYFIPDRSGGAIDGSYEVDEPRIRQLLREIADRGHEIGVHGSYLSFRDGAQVARERRRLAEACAAAGITTPPAGNRQHYLRWDAAETPDHLEAAGFTYDSSGSFADLPGFRFGTSRPFPMWSWRQRAPLGLEQRPLVLMECSVISEAYLGLGHGEEARALMSRLKCRAMEHGGDFTMLWHNSELRTRADRDLFESLLG